MSPHRPQEDPPVRLAAALVCVPLLLTACSSSSDGPPEPELPAEADFAAGSCREAAPDLLELGRTIPRLGDDASVPREVQQSLADVQDRLASFAQAPEPELTDVLPVLVERIGGVRIRAVGNSYDPSLGEDLQQAYDEVISTCTGA
jgi:hypothetical protein